MQELGIGLVNAQAQDITALVYPEWALDKSWNIVGKVGQDEEGYDLYQLERPDESITVPSNRLVFMQSMLERMRT